MAEPWVGRTVTRKEFVEYIQRKIGVAKCPMCGKQDFSLVQQGQNIDDASELIIMLLPAITLTEGVASFGMSCTNCGFLMSFSANAVLADIDRQVTKNGV